MRRSPLAREGLGLDEAYQTALARGDRRGAVVRVVLALDEGRGTEDLLHDVSVAQQRVGERWQCGEWSIAQEHAATAINEDIVSLLGVRTEVETTGGLAVVACPPGEWHYLPAKVLAEGLRLAGWRCHYLGASLPADQMGLLVEDLGPDFVALSCSVPSTLPGLRDMIEAVRESGTPVLAGGRGTGPQGRWALRLGATAWAPDFASAVVRLRRPDWPKFVAPVPKLRQPDQESQALLAAVEALAEQAMLRLTRRFPAMESYTPRQLRATQEDLRHIVRFLAAALLVDDPLLFEDFLAWLTEVLAVRGVPKEALQLGLQCLDVPGPRGSRVLREAREALQPA
ncbi:MAG: cobalamin-dependent protein [Mycobacteriales bacterium]